MASSAPAANQNVFLHRSLQVCEIVNEHGKCTVTFSGSGGMEICSGRSGIGTVVLNRIRHVRLPMIFFRYTGTPVTKYSIRMPLF